MLKTGNSDAFFREKRLTKNIFISHRLASAKMADRILVLSKGQIQEEGSHAELMERGGIYADMYRMQSSWYENHGSERECDEENRKYI